jgi:hypothetical protein
MGPRYIATTLLLAVAVFASAIVLLDAALGGKTVGDDLGFAASPDTFDDGTIADRNAPWALLGTVDHGRALRVFPLTRRPECGVFRVRTRDDRKANAVVVDLVVDYDACPKMQSDASDSGTKLGPVEDVRPRTIVVPLDRPLDGRTVGGSMLTYPERSFGDRVVDLRGLSLAQAGDVATMLRAKLEVHGPDEQDAAGVTVSLQRPLNIGPGERLHRDRYKVFTRRGR